jgi:Tol biopolymer transport system component
MPAGPFAQPHVHPDGSAVVFWGGLSGRPRIWLYEFASQIARPLTGPEAGSIEPSFDWRGERIVFAADVVGSDTGPQTAAAWRRGDSNIFVMTAKGLDRVQVTRGNFQDSRPAFSPDAKLIVFLSNRGGDRRGVYVVPADGSREPRRLVKESGFARPWFSVDGKFIYATYFGREPTFVPAENTRVWRLSLDGEMRDPITPDGMPNSQGVFGDYDGTHLWFHSDTAYRFNLRTRELEKMTPPGFGAVWHISSSRNGVRTFDTTTHPAER